MTHGLSDFSSYEDTKKWVNAWIASKDADAEFVCQKDGKK